MIAAPTGCRLRGPSIRGLAGGLRAGDGDDLHAVLFRQFATDFGHAARHEMQNGISIVDSYHCSRYNTNTGRLTAEMFEDAVRTASIAAGFRRN